MSRQTDKHQPPQRGEDIHDQLMVIDGLQVSTWTRRRFEELREGGITCIHASIAVWENFTAALAIIERWQQMFREHSDVILQARTVSDIHTAKRAGKTAVFLGFQNTAPLEDNLGHLSLLAELGVRCIQLTYNVQNSVGGGCWDNPDGGLTEHVGRALVQEMNKLGVLIDVSHCGDKTAIDAAEYSKVPIAITHGNPRSIVGDDVELFRRNHSDEAILAVAGGGGVIGLSMYPRLAPGGSESSRKIFCDAVLKTIELVGIDHVGIGTDFNLGMTDEDIAHYRTGDWSRTPSIPIGSQMGFPDWIPSPASFPTLTSGLEEAGLDLDGIRAVMGGNWLRLFHSVWVDQA